MLAELRQSLYSVPLNQTLGVVPVSVAPGEVLIELPHRPSLLDHAGALHTAALFAVGELAAGVVLATHPDLAEVEFRRTGTSIRYASPCYGDVLAQATCSAEQVAGLREGEAREMTIDVRLRDAAERDVAVVENRFVATRPSDR